MRTGSAPTQLVSHLYSAKAQRKCPHVCPLPIISVVVFWMLLIMGMGHGSLVLLSIIRTAQTWRLHAHSPSPRGKSVHRWVTCTGLLLICIDCSHFQGWIETLRQLWRKLIQLAFEVLTGTAQLKPEPQSSDSVWAFTHCHCCHSPALCQGPQGPLGSASSQPPAAQSAIF